MIYLSKLNLIFIFIFLSNCMATSQKPKIEINEQKPKIEAKEVQDAFEKEDNENLKEELGDLLLQIVLQSKIAEENKLFSFNEVIDNLCEKLIRRHPYVFQDKRPHTIEEQREAYFKIKEFEKSK